MSSAGSVVVIAIDNTFATGDSIFNFLVTKFFTLLSMHVHEFSVIMEVP